MKNPLAISARLRRLPAAMTLACQRSGTRLTEHILAIDVDRQRLAHFHARPPIPALDPADRFAFRREYVISTSRYGTGQAAESHRTPLGLHRIARKIGDGQLPGVVFRGRQPVGLTWNGCPNAPIAHRILWLEGLEPGFNRGGRVDTFSRYIYIHGLGDEPTLGRPASIGCIHMAAADLTPLFDILPALSLVWISRH